MVIAIVLLSEIMLFGRCLRQVVDELRCKIERVDFSHRGKIPFYFILTMLRFGFTFELTLFEISLGRSSSLSSFCRSSTILFSSF
jgi:hypothetical protein